MSKGLIDRYEASFASELTDMKGSLHAVWSDQRGIGSEGKFFVLMSPACGEIACSILSNETKFRL